MNKNLVITFDSLPIDIHVLILDACYAVCRKAFLSLITSRKYYLSIAYARLLPRVIGHKGMLHACRRGYLDYYMLFVDRALKNSVELGANLSHCLGVYLAAAIDSGSANIIKHLIPFHTKKSLRGGKRMAYDGKNAVLVPDCKLNAYFNARDSTIAEPTMSTVNVANIRVYSSVECTEALASACEDFSLRLYYGLAPVASRLTPAQVAATLDILFKIRNLRKYNWFFQGVTDAIIEKIIEAGRLDLTQALINDQRTVEATASLTSDIVFAAARTSQVQFIDQAMVSPYNCSWKRDIVKRLIDVGSYTGLWYLANKYNFPIDDHVYSLLPEEILKAFIRSGRISDQTMYKILLNAIEKKNVGRVSICLPAVSLTNDRAINIINSGVAHNYPYALDLLLNPSLEPSNDMWLSEDYWTDHIRGRIHEMQKNTDNVIAENDIAIMSYMMSEASHAHRVCTLNLYNALVARPQNAIDVDACRWLWKMSREESRWSLERIVTEYMKVCKETADREYATKEEQRKIQRYWLEHSGASMPEWSDDSLNDEIFVSEDDSMDNEDESG